MMPIHNGTDNFRCHLPIKVYNEYNTINFCERFNITCRFMFVHMYDNFSQRFMFTEAILSYFVGRYSRFTLTFTRCSRFTVIITYDFKFTLTRMISTVLGLLIIYPFLPCLQLTLQTILIRWITLIYSSKLSYCIFSRFTYNTCYLPLQVYN